jgi:hypothetical protein
MNETKRPLRVIIESPLGSRPDGTRIDPDSKEFQDNVTYARACMLDSLRRGEAPYGSHLLYPQCLDDATPEEREQGIQAGFAWGAVAELVAVYCDKGLTAGMRRGIARAQEAGQRIAFRALNGAGVELSGEFNPTTERTIMTVLSLSKGVEPGQVVCDDGTASRRWDEPGPEDASALDAEDYTNAGQPGPFDAPRTGALASPERTPSGWIDGAPGDAWDPAGEA